MNLIKLVSSAFKTLCMVYAIVGGVSTAYAGDDNCWAEFFQHSDYAGLHFRLAGPIQLENLLNINGENWASRIDSLKVGPKATLIVFENTNFKLTLKEIAKYPDLMHSLGVTEQDVKEDEELFFGANATIHDLSDFNFHHKVRSLKMDCLK